VFLCHQQMAQQAGRRYLRAFIGGFFVAVPVTVTILDRLAYVARVEGTSMQVRAWSPSGTVLQHTPSTLMTVCVCVCV